jgi:hypothetical protein
MSDQQLEPMAQQEILAGAPMLAATLSAAPMPAPAPAATRAAAPVPLLAPAPAGDAAPGPAPMPAAGAPADGALAADAPEAPTPCTQAQLRRFIKSRPYVPLHELRRRFGLNGADDDVCGVNVDGHRVFIGLPERESGLLGELLRQGDLGYELLLDPTSPLVIGVFPMRPVQRP